MRQFNYYSLVICILVVVSSCGLVTQRYTESTLDDAQQTNLYRDYTFSDSASLAHIAWRDFFTDKHLHSLIERGLEQNHNLQNAILRIASTENILMQSKASFFPILDFSPQIIYNRASQGMNTLPSNTNIDLQTTSVALGFSTNWEIEIWGKLSASKRASQAAWMQSVASKNAVQTALISTIASAYYTLMALDQQLSIAQATVENRTKSVQTLQALMESGNVTGADVVQAQASVYEAQVHIPELRQAIREVENTICVLLGQPLQAIERGNLEGETLNAELKVGVPIELLSRRPDVQAAEHTLRQNFELSNVAKASLYPSIRLSAGSAGISALTTRTLLASSNVFINLVGGLTQPIFQRRLLKTNHQNALIAQQQALNTFEQTLLIAGQEVTDALYAHQIATEKQDIRSQQIASLEQAVEFRMQLLTYSSSTNYTDVLSSEQLLLATQLATVNDKLQECLSIIALYRSLGGGTDN